MCAKCVLFCEKYILRFRNVSRFRLKINILAYASIMKSTFQFYNFVLDKTANEHSNHLMANNLRHLSTPLTPEELQERCQPFIK